ncbi:hypothetical protein GH153_06235 [bacterium]|nr:hypothetical protein [bacterium]
MFEIKFQKVLIEWVDSKGDSREWEYLDEIESIQPSKCISIGFLLEDTPKYKTIAQNLSENQILGRITIPTCSILKIKVIK